MSVVFWFGFLLVPLVLSYLTVRLRPREDDNEQIPFVIDGTNLSLGSGPRWQARMKRWLWFYLLSYAAASFGFLYAFGHE